MGKAKNREVFEPRFDNYQYTERGTFAYSISIMRSKQDQTRPSVLEMSL